MTSVRLASVRRSAPSVGPGLVILALVGSLVGLAWSMESRSYDIWAAFWIGPALMLLSVLVANRAARREHDPALGRLILASAALKVTVGSLARYFVAFHVYGGSADAGRYHDAGRDLAPLFRNGNYANLGEISGTRFMEILTGQIYVFTGPTRLGGFMVYSWLAFVGLYFMYRAFRLAVPDGDHRRYRLLIFLFPSLLFWPSSIGKESWMVFCLGLISFGVARLLAGHLTGVIVGGIGLWGAAIVRPHVALVVLMGLVAAAPVRWLTRRGETDANSALGRAASKLALAIFLVAAFVLVTGQAAKFFGLEKFDVESADEALALAQERTGQGGSEFGATPADTPLAFVTATVTVLFRPFPFEARNVQALASAAESGLLLVLFVLSARRLLRLPRSAQRRPYLLFSLIFVGGFIYAFSVIENFGILARQRVQMLPFFFALLAIAPRAQPSPPGGSGEALPQPVQGGVGSADNRPQLVNGRVGIDPHP